ncbi:NADPH-dependent F420 reductase [Aquimarina celericrescens]|uniref:NADPH-dependent F420 reductase n=1 Tax=Aquimarina celericrescens TaxID=1964542 RepID=A0ABW5B165_9FLAO|nr:NADPH-dependent F420 reductase [Aquimarina celericrescens]
MKLAFIGIGNVGFSLANNLQKKGHDIIIAHSDPESNSIVNALQKNNHFKVMLPQQAVDASDIVFLAVPFNANEEALQTLQFTGKTLIDCTNPVGSGITHGLESKISGAEKVQEWAKDAEVVKAYTIYGFENLEDSNFSDYNVKPVMLIAGNDSRSKDRVATLNTDLGFETLDVGDLSQSLHLEHMTLLWINIVRANGHHPNFTWAYLEK